MSDFLSYLQHGALADATSERELTALRRNLLINVLRGDAVSVELLAALARFCADCEYVFLETSKETAALESLDPGKSEAEKHMLACYRQAEAEALPLDDIEQLRPLENKTSKMVGAQYEEHPYPRWRVLPEGTQNTQAIDILIAGCGTGREPLIEARGSPLSRVVGLDLSRASLAYALKRAREYNIANIRFLQGDLLDVGLLGRKFDVIKCSGVLHHMADPGEGLLALKSVLADGGAMKIALYSARNRAATFEAIKFRKQRGIPSTSDAIRRFRQELLALPDGHPAKGVTTSADFYSVSGTRDLLFHVQEQAFTIRGVADLVAGAGLKLLEFGAGEKPQLRFKEMGFTDQRDLSAWEKVEDRSPGTFSGMYRFVVGL